MGWNSTACPNISEALGQNTGHSGGVGSRRSPGTGLKLRPGGGGFLRQSPGQAPVRMAPTASPWRWALSPWRGWGDGAYTGSSYLHVVVLAVIGHSQQGAVVAPQSLPAHGDLKLLQLLQLLHRPQPLTGSPGSCWFCASLCP